MGTYFHSNLKYLRIKHGIEQVDLAQMIGLKSGSAVSEWEKGIRIPNSGVISDLASIFKVSIDNLMKVDLESYNPGNSTPIPLIGEIAAGSPLLACENVEDYFNIDTKIKADFALRVKGNSMIDANINNGDIAFIRKQPNLESGEIGAVLIDDSATLKKFYKDDETIILQSENKEYKPMIYNNGDIQILGKLVAVLNIV